MSSTTVTSRTFKSRREFQAGAEFTWTIDKFKNERLPYRSDSVKVWGNMKITLELRSCVNETGTVMCVKPFFCFSSVPSDRDLPVDITISTTRGGAKYVEGFMYPYHEYITTPANLDFIYQSGIESYLENGALVLLVEVVILTYFDSPPRNSTIDERHSDFTITAGEEKFKVHKAILSRSSSSVFCRMFETESFVENQTNEMTIADFSKEAFRDFLLFIYSGEILDFDRNAKELLAIADMFDVQPLKNLCELQLLARVNEDNANDLYQAASLYSCKKLKPEAFNFIKKAFEKHNFEMDDGLAGNPPKVQRMIESLTYLNSATGKVDDILND